MQRRDLKMSLHDVENVVMPRNAAAMVAKCKADNERCMKSYVLDVVLPLRFHFDRAMIDLSIVESALAYIDSKKTYNTRMKHHLGFFFLFVIIND